MQKSLKKMPRKRKADKEDSDSSYQEDSEEEEEEDDQDEEYEEEEEEEEVYEQEEVVSNSGTGVNKNGDRRERPAAKAKTTRTQKRRRKTFDLSKDDHDLPTYARKTSKGGYAHTNLSKSRISKANTGNTPWNKGKNRSEADKAKIAAGVKARNRAVLLEKLRRLGMSEEEYNQKTKEIKYLRERIRRTKKANNKHSKQKAKADQDELQLKLKALNSTTGNVRVSNVCPSTTVFIIRRTAVFD